MRVIKWLDDHLEEAILVILLIGITCVMMLQILARYLGGGALPWPEEFCRLCWIWSVFLSLAYTIKKGNMLRVNILVEQFPKSVTKVFMIMADLLILLSMALLFKASIPVFEGYVSSHGATPAMLWPMWLVYGLVCILGFGLAAFRAVEVTIHDIRHFNDHLKTTIEMTIEEAEAEAAAVMGDAAKESES